MQSPGATSNLLNLLIDITKKRYENSAWYVIAGLNLTAHANGEICGSLTPGITF
ncbi:hypothetical protein ACJX0J_025719, partial [Zea mays]